MRKYISASGKIFQDAIALILKYIQSEKEYHTALKNMVPITYQNIKSPPQTISIEEGRNLLWGNAAIPELALKQA